MDERPDAVAVAAGDSGTTYRDLDHLANRMARLLRSIGVGRGSLVAILLPRSMESCAAILAVLKSGAAYVPLDPGYPADRVGRILADCRASAAVTSAPLEGLLTGFPGAVLRVDADAALIGRGSHRRFRRGEVDVGPRDLCCVIYTSDSAGRPKGVMIEHRSARRLVEAEASIFAIRPRDRVCQGSSLACDAAVEEVWLAFRAGATLVPATPEMARAGPDLPRILTASGVTVLSCDPTPLSKFTGKLPRLRLLILRGGTCPDELVARWARPGLRIVNTYGPTEATVIATHADLRAGEPVTIGRPLPGYRVHLLDDALRPVSRGEVGELCIGGVGVARGYLGLADETRARFVPDPFAPPGEIDARMVRTGDLARQDARGNLVLLGRAEGPEKLQGIRIERAEIESTLLQCKEVLGAACAASEDELGTTRLVAYVVPRPGWRVDEPRLRSHLREKLPPCMVPERIEVVADLPRIPPPPPAAAPARRDPDRWRIAAAGLVQAVGLVVVLGTRGVQWLAPSVAWFVLLHEGMAWPRAAAWALAVAVASLPLALAFAIGAKWALLGRIRAGRHPLLRGYHLRWWFVQSLVRSLPLGKLARSPLLPAILRLFGARIGRAVHLGTDQLSAFDLISIGDGTSIDDGASLHGCTIDGGELVVGPVTIGRDCFVGTRSILREHTCMEPGARLDDLSLLPRGASIPRGETWAGSPARRIAGSEEPVASRPPATGAARRVTLAVTYALLALTLPLVLPIAFVPWLVALTWIDAVGSAAWIPAALPLAGAAFVLLLALEVLALKWLIVGRVRAGTVRVDGLAYLRKWVLDHLLGSSREGIGSLHSTLYVAPWYRALGARIGRFVELSTAASATPDLLEIDDGGTVADEVSFGAARVERGWMTLAPTRLGRRAFVGDDAVMRAGATLGDGSLVGVLSISPEDPLDASRPGTSWLGSPPFALPRRQPSTDAIEGRTYAPSRKLRLQRGAFELLRVTLPPAGWIAAATIVVEAALLLRGAVEPWLAWLLLPLAYAAACAIVAAAVVAAKWILLGRVRPSERPLWSFLVWRLELVKALHEFLLEPLAVGALKGTPMLPWFLRALGARIGRGVHLDTTDLTEFDLVEIGDRTVLNLDCTLQTRVLEDRILKVSRLRIGADCEVGAGSVVLCDSDMQAGSRLDALSLLRMGETLPAGTAWIGIPALRQLGSGEASSGDPPPDAEPRPLRSWEPVVRRAVAHGSPARGRSRG